MSIKGEVPILMVHHYSVAVPSHRAKSDDGSRSSCVYRCSIRHRPIYSLMAVVWVGSGIHHALSGVNPHIAITYWLPCPITTWSLVIEKHGEPPSTIKRWTKPRSTRRCRSTGQEHQDSCGSRQYRNKNVLGGISVAQHLSTSSVKVTKPQENQLVQDRQQG